MPTVYFQHKYAVYVNNVTSQSEVIFLLGYYENFLSAFLTFFDFGKTPRMGRLAHRKASTGQHNTEKRGYMAMPPVG
jgi:hypothetical protein